jgi:hypothetical protein
MLYFLLLAIGAYLAILAALYFTQTAMLFPVRLAADAGPLRGNAQALVLETASGDRLHGVHVPASAQDGEQAPVTIGFGGNAWNGAAVADYLHELFPRSEIFVFHFRGYAPSGGRPSARALLADALLVHDLVAGRVRGRPVIVVGFSIGAGVAAHLASRRKLDGVILVTPFDSLARVAGDQYPWVPVRLLFRHEMNAVEDLRRSATPVALIAAGRDRLIAPGRTAALRAAVPNLVFDRTIPDADHNDIYDRPEFRQAMADALETLARSAPK